MISTNYVNFLYTARYLYTLQKVPCTRILYVLHGYGETGRKILEAFNAEGHSDWLIVACEGLSKFYLKGAFNGKVGCSWMTKEDRLIEIKNYISYLENVRKDISSRFSDKMLSPNITASAFAFSQGTHTLARWIAESKETFASVVFFGGTLPEDINMNQFIKKIKQCRVYYLLGDNDSVVSRDDVENSVKRINEAGGKAELIITRGSHAVTSEIANKAFDIIDGDLG